MRHLPFIVVATLVASLPACVNLDPQPDETRYYVLSSEQALSSMPGESAAGGLTVGVKALSVASYLDTRRMVTRVSANEVKFSEVSRWGEDLRQGVANALADFLRVAPGIGLVYVVPWTQAPHRDFDVGIRLERFEGDVDGGTRLLASWFIEDPETGRRLRHGVADLPTDGWTPGDFGDLAAQLGHSVQGLAGVLAEGMKELR